MSKGKLAKISYTPSMSLERRVEYVRRNDEIRRLRVDQRWPLADIAAEFGIYDKRVSQIAPSGFRVSKNAR